MRTAGASVAEDITNLAPTRAPCWGRQSTTPGRSAVEHPDDVGAAALLMFARIYRCLQAGLGSVRARCQHRMEASSALPGECPAGFD